jgi:periplasmic protein TonB
MTEPLALPKEHRLDDDPMSRVLGLDANTSSIGAWLGFTSGGVTLLGGLLTVVSVVGWLHAPNPAAVEAAQEIDVATEAPPPPPPSPTQPDEEKHEAPPAPRVTSKRSPPPSPAQAAKVLTSEPTPDDPVDLTANTIVQGNAESFAGGFTAATGTGNGAASGVLSAVGAHGPAGLFAFPSVKAPDRSRVASLAGASEWSCPFPPEADSAQIDEAYVTLQVDVGPDGAAAAARVLADPGNGFGREARRCAMIKHYAVALDRDGNPIAGATKPFRVHFSR